MVLSLRLFGYKFALIWDSGVLLLNLIIIIVIKKKKICQTHRSNSINVDWVGLSWILVMSWVKFDFFNLPWWVELKKSLNPIHAHHYFNYVTSNFCYIGINTYTTNFIIFKVINYITFLSILLFTNYNLSKKKLFNLLCYPYISVQMGDKYSGLHSVWRSSLSAAILSLTE